MEGFPRWFSEKGMKMRLASEDQRGGSLVIKNNAAQLVVRSQIDSEMRQLWRLEWEICGCMNVQGTATWRTEELRSAFGLSDVDFNSDQIRRRYESDVASLWHFIRKGNYLNIPGPGTGESIDPNLSLVLDDKIKAAVQRLLNSVEAPQSCYFQHGGKSYPLDPDLIGVEFVELDGQTFRVGEWQDGLPTDLVPVTAAHIQSI